MSFVCIRLWVDNLFVWLCWYLIVGWLTICLCGCVCIWLWVDNLFVFGVELTICLCGCVCICLWVDNLFVFDCAVVVG